MCEQNLKEFQSNSAENLLPGVLPAVKQALGSIKKEMIQSLGEKLDSSLTAALDKGNAPLATEFASLRSCFATSAAKQAETNLLVKSTMGAVIMVDKNLQAVGLGAQDQNAAPVNIPSMLDQIQAGVKASVTSSSPSPWSSATVDRIEYLKPSKAPAGSRFATPSPAPGSRSCGAPPSKAPRWDAPGKGDMGKWLVDSSPAPRSGSSVAPGFAPRSLAPEFESPGAFDPELYSAMMEAKAAVSVPDRRMSSEQIGAKIKEQKEMMNKISSRKSR